MLSTATHDKLSYINQIICELNSLLKIYARLADPFQEATPLHEAIDQVHKSTLPADPALMHANKDHIQYKRV